MGFFFHLRFAFIRFSILNGIDGKNVFFGKENGKKRKKGKSGNKKNKRKVQMDHYGEMGIKFIIMPFVCLLCLFGAFLFSFVC
jgi:hypothetical protein